LVSYEYLKRLEGKIRNGIFFMMMYSKITVLTESCFNESIKIRIYLLNLQYLITY
jgi:hypothetical protein